MRSFQGGEVLLDQSMLTGESVPIEAGAGLQIHAGALVRRGKGRSHGDRRPDQIRSYRRICAHRPCREYPAEGGPACGAQSRRGVIMLLVAYSWYLEITVADIIPLVLTAILASISVALPATFTLGSALGPRPGEAGCPSDTPVRQRLFQPWVFQSAF
jgi:H+-transporting ATPase